jgi:hypothetical protein
LTRNEKERGKDGVKTVRTRRIGINGMKTKITGENKEHGQEMQ